MLRISNYYFFSINNKKFQWVKSYNIILYQKKTIYDRRHKAFRSIFLSEQIFFSVMATLLLYLYWKKKNIKPHKEQNKIKNILRERNVYARSMVQRERKSERLFETRAHPRVIFSICGILHFHNPPAPAPPLHTYICVEEKLALGETLLGYFQHSHTVSRARFICACTYKSYEK